MSFTGEHQKWNLMKNSVAFPLLLPLLFALACTSENSSNMVAKQQNARKFDSTAFSRDAEFAVRTASSGFLEIELGVQAATTSSSPRVKAFGSTMTAAHAKATEQIKSIATSKNITLPSVPDNDKQKWMDHLKQKSGAEFDKAYIDLMIRYHKEDIEHCRKEIEKGNDPEIKALATSILPVLQHHLQMAEEIRNEMNK
jgi:putative membrane protein